ncbi:SWIM zinc finger family protein [Paraburkholderia eburnea]|uniref:SWIM zinc finger family protein n=1 Tax=Paraburkholderia eburnea TaxID=1189126 RepID=UPI0011B041FD
MSGETAILQELSALIATRTKLKTEFVFNIQGSSEAPYEVTFRKQAVGFTASCTCTAGINGQFCKHRIGVLNGTLEDASPEQISAMTEISSWIPGSAYEAASIALTEAEAAMDAAKRRVTEAKKMVSIALRTGDLGTR